MFDLGSDLDAFSDQIGNYDRYQRWYNNDYLGSLSFGNFSGSQINHTESFGFTDILSSPRFHGAMQAIGGFSEAGVGAALTLSTKGVLGSVVLPLMAHGLDNCIAGVTTAFTGIPRDTLTFQLLQKTGMSQQTAGLVDNGISLVGSMGGAWFAQQSRFAASAYRTSFLTGLETGTFMNRGTEATIAKNFGKTNSIWTATKSRTSVENAFKHWKIHRSEFSNLYNSKQYVQAAREFITKPPTGTLTKLKKNGDFFFIILFQIRLLYQILMAYQEPCLNQIL